MRCSPVPHLRLHLPVNLAPRPSPLRPAPPPPSSPIRFSPRPFPRRRRGLLAPRPSGHGRSAAGSPSPGSPEDDFDVELGRLLALLPEEMRRRVGEHPERSQLIEVVMDLGRKPLARFPSGDFVLSELPVTHEDLERATSQVGDFAVDNRAGISRTLHRISGIRNRKGTIIGLTCRVGRAISGSAPLLRDLVQTGDSLLLIGPPGVGKTTIIREIARMLANDYGKRVMIVDTSNEIGGDGDIPHEGIGNARRMQVPNSDMQHKVLIEAVENHMPQVIVIDEIGTKLEAMAASTIAQRGIQLVATAHGVTIENLIMNPALEMLVGGIQSVTLGDEEASRRGVQKTVLERKGPSTFSCGVEIVSKTELRVHRSLEATVDAVLSGRLPKFEVRKMGTKDSRGNAETEPFAYSSLSDNDDTGFIHVPDRAGETAGYSDYAPELPPNRESFREDGARLSLYNYGTSSLVQITNAVRALLRDRDGSEDTEVEDKSKLLEKTDALEEARVAIEQVVIPKGEPVELLPRSSSIMSLQLDLIRKYQLQSERVGKEPDILLRILPYDSGSYEDGDSTDNEVVDGFDDFGSTNGSTYNISKLPLLPD
ncbi:protein SEEDLING PLASTID DEVELOPMENT 1 isoform X2 [Syzygium oleosum]|uniref:protein SEEDLING PLASTID DEVELOPMENT 1 isoform X2 n=1 Tax=Syzygium oleosum TaxID=219896 RepID=UPI0011D1F70A|nr:protein SEEDLING PLASTID DEVELOPMENT 1 isoform X2 [Syzygium oleosum]